jgi:hypothetical protein
MTHLLKAFITSFLINAPSVSVFTKSHNAPQSAPLIAVFKTQTSQKQKKNSWQRKKASKPIKSDNRADSGNFVARRFIAESPFCFSERCTAR